MNRHPQPTPPTFFNIILFAFLGGLILNIMPCVLPILGVKATQLVQTPIKKRLIHSLQFCAGILVSMWVLAGCIILLQQFGVALGWGFQLQSAGFIIGLIALFYLLFLFFH